MKKRGVFLIGLIVISVYYFLFPRGSGPEFVLQPIAVTPFGDDAPTDGRISASAVAVRGGERIGFLDDEGALAAYFRADALAAGDGWIALRGPEGVDIRDADGRLRARLNRPMQPETHRGRLYLGHRAAGRLLGVDPRNGAVLWEREYLVPITVVDGSADRTLIGLLDGRIQLVDDDGRVLLDYQPGGSRLEAVYGGALSADGRRIAIVSGLDPQRFILLEERKNGYRPVSHHSTETDYRRRVAVGFVRSDAEVLYERSDGVADVALESFEVRRLEAPGRPVAWMDGPLDGFLTILGSDGDEAALRMVASNDRMMFHSILPSRVSGIQSVGDKLLIVDENRIAILESAVR